MASRSVQTAPMRTTVVSDPVSFGDTLAVRPSHAIVTVRENIIIWLLCWSHVWFVVKVIVFSSLVSPTDPLCTRYMEFVCQNRAQCLFQSLVCDGIKHCEDGSDEDAEYAQCGERQSSPLWYLACLQQPSCDHPLPCNTWPGQFIKQRCRMIIVPNKEKRGGWVCFPLTRAPEQWIVRFVLCVWICLSLQLGFASGSLIIALIVALPTFPGISLFLTCHYYDDIEGWLFVTKYNKCRWIIQMGYMDPKKIRACAGLGGK